MNWAHIHLVLTHIPVIGIGAIIVVFAAGRLRRSQEIERLSLQMFVALALLSVAVYLTGSPANHQMQQVPGVSRENIHRHSQAADFAFWSMEALGALSLASMVKFRRTVPIPNRILTATLVLALIVFALMLWTAGLGGKIRHPEIESRNFHLAVRP